MRTKNLIEKEPRLDTLETSCHQEPKLTKKQFKKRQKAKTITKAETAKLLGLNSTLHKGYRRAHYCAENLLQDGNKVTSQYCHHRVCNVCNRIKSAKMMKAYFEPLSKINDMQFVTLTAPTVYGDELSSELTRKQKAFAKIKNNIRKKYKHLEMKGVSKLECTYNYRSKKYNSHLHLLVSSRATAEEVLRQWLAQFPEADMKAQDIRKASKNVLFEVFKYVTKSVVGGHYSATATDTILQAMANRNTYYPFGGIRKVKEEVDSNELESQIISFGSETIDVWRWCNGSNDWYNAQGQPFIGEDVSFKTKSLVKVIAESSLKEVKKVNPIYDIYKEHRKHRQYVF